jgi:hypothetical protein
MSETSLVLPEGAAPVAEIEPDAEPPLAPVAEVEEETGQRQAFPAQHFRIDIPEVDGVDAEAIVIGFSGSVELSMKDEASLALFNALTLGKEVELRVAGVVADKASPLRVDKDGGKTMIRKAKVAVHTVHALLPEDL